MVQVIRGSDDPELFNLDPQDEERLIYGNGGDDVFNVFGDDDELSIVNVVAGDGNDALNVTYGTGFFLGGDGNDTLDLRNANYVFDGGAGNDTLNIDAPIESFAILSAGSAATLSRGSGFGDDDDDDDDDDDAPAEVAAAESDADDDDDDDDAEDVGTIFAEVRSVDTYVFGDLVIRQNDGNALIDDLFYLSRNLDVADAGIDPEAHFALSGRFEGRDPNAFFDAQGYLEAYADVRAAGVDPLAHYLANGASEGRNPSARFDTRAYLADNPDVAAAGINPLQHYLQSGAAEGRAIVGDDAFLV